MDQILIPNSKDDLSRDQIEYLQKQQRENKLIGSKTHVPGHTLFSYNFKTGEIKKADITREVEVDFKTHQPIYKNKVQIEPDCYYDEALNRRNFIKRLKRMALKSR